MIGNGHRKELLGYSDRLTVRPGERIEFKVSSQNNDSYNAQLVRLVNGDVHSSNANFREVEIESSINGEYSGRVQRVAQGSCVVVDRDHLEDAVDQTTIALNVLPTTPTRGLQHLISRWNDVLTRGWTLHIDRDGFFSLTLGAGALSWSISIHCKLKPRVWYHVAATIDWRTRHAALHAMQSGSNEVVVNRGVFESSVLDCKEKTGDSVLLIAAAFGGRDASGRVIPVGCFNGRIEAPVIYSSVLERPDLRDVLLGKRPAHLSASVIADWDFSVGIAGATVHDRSSSHAHGYTHNLPLRAVRGTRWSGRTMEWSSAPEEYSAIHFHSDDLYDCGWRTDFEFVIPETMRSGIYAMRLRTAACEEYIPFMVAAPKRSPQSSVALLVPTYTYLAYGNFHALETNRKLSGKTSEKFYEGQMMGPGSQNYALSVEEHYDLGLSLYDWHTDGSPVHFSSWLRPLLNVRPKSVLWTLCADLFLTDWLEMKNFQYDVISDDLLQQEGIDLLNDYRVVITGNHPEYCTTSQVEAISSYVAGGGRLMYLGGNGFYWRVGIQQSFPAAIEVRRGQTGTAVHRSAVGEACLAFTGEVGGIWRDLGRPPQEIVGVGFIAEGAGSSYYRVLPDVREGAAAFILDGVEGEILGDFGIFGGAAGQEIDKSNHDHGTPENAIIVARSENHGAMLYVIEEMLGTYPVPEYYRHLVCSEIVLFGNENGGAVFSVGSMAWCGSLGHNDYINNISRVTANVLNKFIGEDGV